MEKTFYLETFGCQMNVHDSEKVIGTLLHEGYRQVETEEEAGLILYNTCSIRDKAEQKVFNRLNDYKKLHKQGKRFAVLGCVAQQEGEKIFERAPYVSLVSGSASYRKLPEMLVRLRIRRSAASPASTTARPKRPSRPNSPPAPIPTAATSPSSRAATNSAPIASSPTRAAKSAAAPPTQCSRKLAAWLTSGFTEIQLLGQNVNSYSRPSRQADLRRTADLCRRNSRNPPRPFHDFASSRLHARHRGGHRTPRRHFAITSICLFKAGHQTFFAACNGNTRASNIWTALPG